MKRGQLLSQPFFYIFTIVVIGLILIFGFRYVNKLLKTGCEVETADLIGDVQGKVNQLIALSYGSSFECKFTRIGSGGRCEFVVPDNVAGVCFMDPANGGITSENVPFADVKKYEQLASGGQNLFFSLKDQASCKAEPVKIRKLEVPSPVCVRIGDTTASVILTNTGNAVEVTRG